MSIAEPPRAVTTGAPPANGGSEQIRRIQAMLTALGFAPGPADGTLTPMTRDAILEYQRALGLDITGEPSEELAAHLRQLTGNRN
ncbi:MAG: peptidoglycan-binding domain-containing protein [Rhodospirillaceae bacterium]